MGTLIDYLLLLKNLVEEENVVFAATELENAIELMLQSLETPNNSNGKNSNGKSPSKETVLGDDVPHDLKVLLYFFNKEDDKLMYSKDLFNNTDEVGKMFLKIVNDKNADTVQYLIDNVEERHSYTFKQIKQYIEYYHIHFLLCYFLLKNEKMSTGLNLSSSADIEEHVASIDTGDPETNTAVQQITRSLIDISKEPHVNLGGLNDGKKMAALKAGLQQLSKFIKKKKEEVSVHVQTNQEIIEAAIRENESVQSQLGDSVAAFKNLTEMLTTKNEIDAVTKQMLLEDSQKFTENLTNVLSIAKELQEGSIDHDEALKRLERISIVRTDESEDELMEIRNRLLENQQMQLIKIIEHIKEVIGVFIIFKSRIEYRVARNIQLENEVDLQTKLINAYQSERGIQVAEIVNLQREKELLNKDIDDIMGILNATLAEQKSSLELHFKSKNRLIEQFDKLRQRARSMENEIEELRDRVNELEESELDLIGFTERSEKEIAQKKALIADLKTELANNKELLDNLQVKSEEYASNLEEEKERGQEKDKVLERVSTEYDAMLLKFQELLEEKKAELAAKDMQIVHLTKEIDEAGKHTGKLDTEIEQTKKESRAKIEEIINNMSAEIEKLNNQLGKKVVMNEELKEKMNKIIAEAKVKIAEARKQATASKKNAEQLTIQKRQLEEQLKNMTGASEAEKTKLNEEIAQLTKQIEDNEAELVQITQNKEGVEAELSQTKEDKSELEKQLAELKRQKEGVEAELVQTKQDKSELGKQVADLKQQKEGVEAESAETKKDNTKLEKQLAELTTKIKDTERQLLNKNDMELKNFLYLTQLRHLNQIIIENRAKLSFGSKENKNSQISEEELSKLLLDIKRAEDSKLLLERQKFDHVTDSIYQTSVRLFKTEERAQRNVDTFIETIEEAKRNTEELEEQLGFKSNAIAAYKVLLDGLESDCRTKDEQLISVQIELKKASKEVNVSKLTAEATIKALNDELAKKEKEIKQAAQEKINLLQKQSETEGVIAKATSQIQQLMKEHEQAIANLTKLETKAKEFTELKVQAVQDQAAANVAAAKSETAEVDARYAAELAEAKKEVATTSQQLAEAKSKLTDKETTIIELQERAKRDVAEMKSSYEDKIKVIKSNLEYMTRSRANVERQKGKLESNLQKETADRKIAESKQIELLRQIASRARKNFNNYDKDDVIEQLQKQLQAVKDELKANGAKNQQVDFLTTRLSDLKEDCRRLHSKRTLEQEQADQELVAYQSVSEGATLIGDLISQFSQNKEAYRVGVLEDIEAKLTELLVSKNELTQPDIEAFFQNLRE